jgi:hypothetical protein
MIRSLAHTPSDSAAETAQNERSSKQKTRKVEAEEKAINDFDPLACKPICFESQDTSMRAKGCRREREEMYSQESRDG